MKITMIGIETALQMNNQHLFDLLVLPAGIDKDDVEDNIMLQGSEFEVVYSEPSLFRSAIGLWGRKYYRTFDKWIKALNLEYNPLENYDRMEKWDDHKERGADNTRTFDNQDKQTLDTEDEETRNTSDETTYDKTTTTTDDVSAFDSNSYQPSTKETLEEDGTVTIAGTGTDTFAHTGTNTMDHTGTIKDETGEEESTAHTGRVHGNVGVTTSQQMLQSELDIARFNIVQQITDLFLQEFCIMIYD